MIETSLVLRGVEREKTRREKSSNLMIFGFTTGAERPNCSIFHLFRSFPCLAFRFYVSNFL